MVEDLRSMNGVAINGRRIHLSPLAYGNILQLGKVFFVLSELSEEQLAGQGAWLTHMENQARQYEQNSDLYPQTQPESPPESPDPAPVPFTPPAPLQTPPMPLSPEPLPPGQVIRTKAADVMRSGRSTQPTTQFIHKKNVIGHPTPSVVSALPSSAFLPASQAAQQSPAAKIETSNPQLKAKSRPDWIVWIVIGGAVLIAVGLLIWKFSHHAAAAH